MIESLSPCGCKKALCRLCFSPDTLYPIDTYHEDHGLALFWTVPINEPPIVGGYEEIEAWHTHWSPIPDPRFIVSSGAIREFKDHA